MFRRALADIARIYGRQWWRIALIQLLALLAGSVVVGIAALIMQGISPDLMAWLGESAATLETRALSLASWVTVTIAIFLLPIQLAALVATVRVADRVLAGGQARLRGSVTATALRFLSLLGATALAVLAVFAAFVLSPFFVLLGLIGLAATGILTLVRRRRPDAAGWWPVLRTWVLATIPFGVLWRVLPTAILMPVAVVLESTTPFGAVRVAETLAAGRRWKITALTLLALLVTVGLSVGAALLGSLVGAETGAALVGGIVQLFVVPLPIVAAVALYRRAAGTNGRALSGVKTAPARSRRTIAGVSPVMTRVATITIATLIATAGLATSMVVAPAQAATVTGTNVTYTVTSSVDSTVAATINSQAASCRVGGTSCTIRGALKAAQQDAADGALGATISFASSMDIVLAAGLTFAPDAVAATASSQSAPSTEKSTTADEPAMPSDESPAPASPAEDAPTNDEPAEDVSAEDSPTNEGRGADEPAEDEPSDEESTRDESGADEADADEAETGKNADEKATDESTESQPAAQGAGATISAAPASFVTKTVSAKTTKTTKTARVAPVAAAQKATSKIVAGKLTIDASGKRVTLNGQDQYQILRVVSEEWNLAVSGLSFSHGYASNEQSGGGALLAGVNKATVTASTFRNNNTFSSGGAIFSREITISGSSFITNRATYYGSSSTGGAVRAVGRATVINSTFSANGIGDQYTPGFNQGSDVYGDAGMDVVNSTFVNSEGGSLAAQSGSAQSTVRNSIFTTNWTGNAAFMCSGNFTGSHNLSAEGDSTCQGGSGTRTSPLVRALDESGIVPVFPLAQGYNPAVATGTSCPAVDALGAARPATACDLGAVEFNGTTSIALEAIPSTTVFGTATFRAQVAAASGIVPSGNIIFTIDGVDQAPIAVNSSGVAEYEVSGLAGGDVFDYSALFLPQAPYDSSAIGPYQYTVQQVKVPVAFACADPGSAQCRDGIKLSDAEAVPFIVTVDDDRAGTVSISRNKAGTQVVAGPVALVDGAATVSVDGSVLGIGSHELFAIYSSDDDQHIGVSTPRTVAVLGQATVTLTVPNASVVHGDMVKGAVTVKVTGNGPIPTGLVQAGGKVGTLRADGTVVIDLSTTQVSAGTHNISAIYEGDASYAHAESAPQPFATTVASTQTRITSVAPQSPNFAKPTTVSVEVTTGAPSTADPAGIVTLLVDGTSTFTGTMLSDDVRQDAKAAFEIVIPAGALSAGTHELVAKYTRDGYSADDNFSPSTSPAVSVDTAKSNTTTSVTAAPSPATYGDQVTLTAKVNVPSAALVPGGTVTFSTSTGDLGTATLADCAAPNADGCSVATLRVGASTLGVGTSVISARYSGAADFSASTGQTSNLVVSKATPTVSIAGGGVLTYGETRTYSIAVTAPGATPTDGSLVAVTAVPQSGAPITLGTVALVGGSTSITVSTLGTLLPGSYTLTATFAGDDHFRSASAAQPVSVSSVATDIDFDSLSATSVTYGNTLQTTFTVKSVGSTLAPEGDVVLSWLGNEVGRATLSAANNTATPGVRTVSIPATFAGTIVSPDTFWLTAEFVPAKGFVGSQLQADNPEERRRVTVTPLEAVVSVDGSAVMGQNLQAVATVTIPGNNFGITPKGAVTFTVNKSGAGTVGPFTTNVVDGKADLSKAYINGVRVDIAGSWTIRATYVKSDTETRYVSTNPNNVAVKQVDVDTTGAIITVDAPEEIAFGSPLKVSVDVSGVTAATGTVRLAGEGVTTADEVQLVNGHAELSAPISRLLALGDHQYSIYYSGDTALRASWSEPFTVRIGKIPTSLTLSSTSTSLAYYPAIVGAKVVYVAQVNLPEGADPVGSVRFSRGDVVLGQVGLNVDKVATISLTPDVEWSGDIVAEYLSGGNNLADSRTTMQHSWVKAPIVVSVTGPGTTTIGSRAPLTTSVAFDLSRFSMLPDDLRPNHNPTGTVTMSDIITGDQCTVPLNPSYPALDAGSASCNFPFTSVGDVFVSATYSGDANYAGGTSGTIVHLDKGTPTLSLTTGTGNADRWFGLASLPVSWSVRGPSAGTVTLKLGETVVCSSSSLTGSCDVAVPRVGAQAGGDVFSLSFSGNPLWNNASTSRTGTIIACVPWVKPTVTPGDTASFEVFPAADCDNGAGYYDNTPIYVNVYAKAGYGITRVSNQGTDLTSAQGDIADDGKTAGIHTLPIKVFAAGTLLPMSIRVETEARCVPVMISTTGITDKTAALSAIDWRAQSACSEPTTVISDSSIVAYFKVDSKVSVGYNTASIPQHSTFYGWAGLTGDARFAQRSLYTIGAENPTITAAFGPLCYTGVPTLVQPDGGTLTTAIPDQNCAEPKSGKTGWSWGTVGAGKLVDAAGPAVRTYFTEFGGDVTRYTPTASTRVWNAADQVYVETRPFTFPITDTPFSITAAYNKCVALTTKVIGDKTLGAPGTITVSPAADCPLVSRVTGESWYRSGASVTLTTAQSKAQKDAGRSGLKFLGWSGLSMKAPEIFHETVTEVLKTDVTATASYGLNSNCKVLNLRAVPSDALTLKTKFSGGENACDVQYHGGFYDQGIAGNVISIDATPTALGEGAEIIFAWATKAPGTASGDPAGDVASTWTRSPFLDQELYGTSDIVAYACEFVTIGTNVYAPDGTLLPAASASNINPATQRTLEDFVRTPASDCAVGADPRSGYGNYAWTVGTQLLPITVADPVAYKFTGWSGDVKGTNKTPDAALSLVGQGHRASGDYYHARLAANFTAICYTLSLPSDTQLLEVITQPNCPGGETSSTPGGGAATTSSKLSYLGGTNVVIHARDAKDTLFRHWVSGTDAIDEEDAHWASVTMSSDKTVVPYYSSKSVGEQVSTYGGAIGNQMAIMSKKLVGVATATVSAVVQAFIMKASLVAQGIGYIAMGLEGLGVHGAGIEVLKNVSTAITSMLALLYAPFDCMTAWSAGGTDNAIYAAQNAIGTAIVTAMSAGAAKAPSTANPLTTLGQLEIQAEKLAKNLKPVATAATTLYNAKKVYDAADDDKIGWETSASEAWSSSGGSVFSSCMMDKTVGMAESVNQVMSRPTQGD